MTVGDNDWITVVENLKEAQKRWERLTRILGREGEDLRLSGMFFKVVVQAV